MWIAGLMQQREEILLKKKHFLKKIFDEELEYFSNYKNNKNESQIQQYKDLTNINSHTLELSNWIKSLNY